MERHGIVCSLFIQGYRLMETPSLTICCGIVVWILVCVSPKAHVLGVWVPKSMSTLNRLMLMIDGLRVET